MSPLIRPGYFIKEKFINRRNMKDRTITITAIFVIIALANYYRIKPELHVRSVEFLSIFAMGLLTGVLLTQLIMSAKNKK